MYAAPLNPEFAQASPVPAKVLERIKENIIIYSQVNNRQCHHESELQQIDSHI
jgi:hypothetical protein